MVFIVLILAGFAVVALAKSGIFSKEEEPVTSQAFITIVQPIPGAVLGVPQPVQISGMGGGLFEGTVVVQALDAGGNVLAQETTTINAPDAGSGGEGPWSVQMVIPVKPGAAGQIYAFSPSPADGSIMAASSVNVTYGKGAAVESFIKITEPTEGTVIAGNPVTVIGMGGGLFEGNVVVQALDNNNNVLTEKATIIDSPDAGGQGPWTVQLHVTVKQGTPGKIYAFSPSPKDGSVDASSQVDVLLERLIQERKL